MDTDAGERQFGWRDQVRVISKWIMMSAGYAPLQRELRSRETDESGKPIIEVYDYRLDDEVNLGGGFSGTEVVIWLAAAAGSGILGNAAYDLIKAAIKQLIERRREGSSRLFQLRRRPVVDHETAVSLALLGVCVSCAKVKTQQLVPEDLEVVEACYDQKLQRWEIQLREKSVVCWDTVLLFTADSTVKERKPIYNEYEAIIPGDSKELAEMRVSIRIDGLYLKPD